MTSPGHHIPPHQRPKQTARAVLAHQRKLRRHIHVSIPERGYAPKRVRAHLGPTNSGKTFQAMQVLQAAGSGTYAAPLRMLAHEMYHTLLQTHPAERIGLVTGEERINPHAAILCCTTEMAPLYGKVLVLDEVHWMADRERGGAWTRLVASAEYQQIELVGAVDAAPLLRNWWPDLQVITHPRLTPLDHAPPLLWDQVPSHSVVITFSRQNVLRVADRYREAGRRVAVLYGSLPLATREQQLDTFRSGKADIMVATDVLGHGVNLPCAGVYFATTSKWDGEQQRPLLAWEMAQIAGRAGRYGQHDAGIAGILLGDHFHGDDSRLALAWQPQIDTGCDMPGFRILRYARIRPTYDDIGRPPATDISWCLGQWYEQARELLPEAHPWLLPEHIGTTLDRLQVIRTTRASLDGETMWMLGRAPLDMRQETDVQTMIDLVRALTTGEWEMWPQHNKVVSLQTWEQRASRARALRWTLQQIPDASFATVQEAADAEEQASKKTQQMLEEQLRVQYQPQQPRRARHISRQQWSQQRWAPTTP